MSNVAQLSTTVRNDLGDAIVARIGSNGRLKIYDGTMPASVGASLSGNNLLVDLPCSATLAPGTSGGVVTLNAITTTNAVATGTATFLRLTTSGGTAHLQGSVGLSGALLNVTDVNFVNGAPVAINSATLTMPGA